MNKILLIILLNISLYSNSSFDFNSFMKNANEYVNQGKLLILSETLKTAINNSMDTNTTEVKTLEINSDNTIKMVVKLIGEDKDFILNIKHFDWSVSKDKKLIVFENIKHSANIAWIDYLISYYSNIIKGYITVNYSSSVENVLSTLKKQIKPTYDTNYPYSKEFWDKTANSLIQGWKDSNKKELTTLFSPIFDKNYIKINSLKIENKKIYLDTDTKDSKEGLSFYINNFTWKTSNDKKYITIENIDIKDCKKPWIIGSIQKRNNSIKFQHSSLVEEILSSIKPH